MPRRLALIVLACAWALLLECGAPARLVLPHATVGAPTQAAAAATVRASPHVVFGVPRDADPSDDYLMDKGAYVLSYNKLRGSANWVAWRLTAADLGPAHRSAEFRADDQVPSDFRRITPNDYRHSGFDRGHLCPSADRTSNEASNSTTFLMSNTLPQVHALNAGPWKGIETYERELVTKAGNDVYVVAGGLFSQAPPTIGRGVAVPIATYRVTLVVRPGSGPRDVSLATPILAVEMPNDTTAKGHDWSDFRVSVDRVEADTGYDFLWEVPDPVENQLEATDPGRRP